MKISNTFIKKDFPVSMYKGRVILQEDDETFDDIIEDAKNKIDAEIRVVTRDTDIFYDVKYNKASNAAGKEIFGEVFRNDRVVFYDESTPCKRKAVTCINEYSRGTLGK